MSSCKHQISILESLDFVIFYNDSPSKLDPKFQALSTLTSKGSEFSRKIGSGLAVIELCLLDSTGTTAHDLGRMKKLEGELQRLIAAVDARLSERSEPRRIAVRPRDEAARRRRGSEPVSDR